MSTLGKERVGVVSAHMDDAVLSCASAITPGSLVVTVFGSGPERVDPLPSWDRACGCFLPGDHVSAVRHQEDDEALSVLGGRGLRLRFWELQYRRPQRRRRLRLRQRLSRRAVVDPDPELVTEVSAELGRVINESGLETWLVPLGVSHEDHIRVTQATLNLARQMPSLDWIVYEDLPYARESAAHASEAHARIAAAGFGLRELDSLEFMRPTHKRRAVSRYRSQVRALGDRVETAIGGPERYYLLVDNLSNTDSD